MDFTVELLIWPGIGYPVLDNLDADFKGNYPISTVQMMGFAYGSNTFRTPIPLTRISLWGLLLPLWFVIAVASILPALWLLRRSAVRKRARGALLGLCPKCSYDLRAHAPGAACPECGTPIPNVAAAPHRP